MMTCRGGKFRRHVFIAGRLSLMIIYRLPKYGGEICHLSTSSLKYQKTQRKCVPHKLLITKISRHIKCLLTDKNTASNLGANSVQKLCKFGTKTFPFLFHYDDYIKY